MKIIEKDNNIFFEMTEEEIRNAKLTLSCLLNNKIGNLKKHYKDRELIIEAEKLFSIKDEIENLDFNVEDYKN